MSDEFDIPEDEPTEILPWINGLAVFARYRLQAPKLRQLIKEKKVRSKKINGAELFSTEDLDKLSPEEGEEKEVGLADLLRASRDLLSQGQKHDELMFDRYMGAFDKLIKMQADQAEKQNQHILDLEKQAMEMREATEKVFSLEHERKMGELREERQRQMQGKALEMLQKTLAPWIMQKLSGMGGGGAVPGAPSTGGAGDGGDPRLAHLGQAVVGMVCEMTDEKFAALGQIIGAAEYEVLTTIREGMKSA